MLDGISIASLTPAALCGVFVLLVFMGRLIPRPTYKEKAEECERWRLAYEKEREARQTSDAQTIELLELAKTTHALISAIVRNADTARETGGSDVAKATS